MKILSAMTPASRRASKAASVSSTGAANRAKSVSAWAAKWSRRIATRSGELQQGSVIGISKSVVIPPLAAAPVSDSTLPRLG